MVIEPKQLTPKDYQNIVKAAEYVDKGGIITCAHDFWERAKTIEYGDVILCTRCWQYFAKIKNLPWVVKERNYLGSNVSSAAHTNHLSDNWYVRVSVRVTD